MKRKGFTLVELMITLAIFTIFSFYLYQTFFSQIRQSFGFNSNIDAQTDANKVLNMITDVIRNNNIDGFQKDYTGTIIQLSSDNKIIVDLTSNNEANVINYNSSAKILTLNKNYIETTDNNTTDNNNEGNIIEYKNIKSVSLRGISRSDLSPDSNNNEIEVIEVTVEIDGNNGMKNLTAINIKR